MVGTHAMGWCAVGLLLTAGLTEEDVPVDGSAVKYAPQIDVAIDGKPVRLTLTGAGLRKHGPLSLYAIGSYLSHGTVVATAEELLETDVPKQLHVVMERTISGKNITASIRRAVQNNHGEDSFPDELKSLGEHLDAAAIKRGDHIRFTHLPRMGISFTVGKDSVLLIRNPAFAKAIWEVYLGENPISPEIKAGLVSRLDAG